jgi:uncharacterized membrane protein YhaH (DUF805 family)
MNWFLTALKKYADFSGRAQRAEFWFFVLFFLIIFIVLTIVDGMIGTMNSAMGMGILSLIFYLAMFVPSLSVTARRLHDTDRSGWWILISLVPLVGSIVLLVFMILDGTPGDNRFGPNPKGATA